MSVGHNSNGLRQYQKVIINNKDGRIRTMVQTKKKVNGDTVGKAVELTQDTAKAALKGAVDTAELTEGYVQGLYKVGYDTNVEGLKIAKNYWDATSQIRQDWIKLFAATGEHLIDASANIEIPFQNKVTDLGKGVVENVSKAFDNLTAKPKTASK